MRIIKFLSMALFAIVMSVGFIACSSDDGNDEGGNNASLVGKWKSAYLSLPHHYDEFGNYIEDPMDENSLDLNDTKVDDVYMYYTFNNNGTGYDVYYKGDKDDFDWEMLDGKLYTYYKSGYSTYYRIIKVSKNVIYVQRNSNNAYLKLVRM